MREQTSFGCNRYQSWDLIDSYKPLKNTEGWLKCKYCLEHPRVWQFNNGNFADCKCGEMYQGTIIRAESIMSWVTRHNGSGLWYNGDRMLRIVWNHYVTTGNKRKLPEGLW
jgi:hypothetical protein